MTREHYGIAALMALSAVNGAAAFVWGWNIWAAMCGVMEGVR